MALLHKSDGYRVRWLQGRNYVRLLVVGYNITLAVIILTHFRKNQLGPSSCDKFNINAYRLGIEYGPLECSSMCMLNNSTVCISCQPGVSTSVLNAVLNYLRSKSEWGNSYEG